MDDMLHALRSLLVSAAFAQPANLDPNTNACDSIFLDGGLGSPGVGFQCIVDYVVNLMFVVVGFAGSVALIMLMINGFRYMIGPAFPGGSSDSAKKGIGAALTGLAVALLAYAILDTLVYFVTQ